MKVKKKRLPYKERWFQDKLLQLPAPLNAVILLGFHCSATGNSGIAQQRATRSHETPPSVEMANLRLVGSAVQLEIGPAAGGYIL